MHQSSPPDVPNMRFCRPYKYNTKIFQHKVDVEDHQTNAKLSKSGNETRIAGDGELPEELKNLLPDVDIKDDDLMGDAERLTEDDAFHDNDHSP